MVIYLKYHQLIDRVVEYYFGIETTGLNPCKDKIVTFQYQGLSEVSGIPLTQLVIVKEWERGCSEKVIVE